MNMYEEVIKFVEEKEVNAKSDAILQRLAQEMEQDENEYQAILEAADEFVKNPAIDMTSLGRIKRMSNIFSQDELDGKIGLLVDVIFANGAMPA